MEKGCYEEEVQPYRKMDYKPIIYIEQDLLSYNHVYVYINSLIRNTIPVNVRMRTDFIIEQTFHIDTWG